MQVLVYAWCHEVSKACYERCACGHGHHVYSYYSGEAHAGGAYHGAYHARLRHGWNLGPRPLGRVCMVLGVSPYRLPRKYTKRWGWQPESHADIWSSVEQSPWYPCPPGFGPRSPLTTKPQPEGSTFSGARLVARSTAAHECTACAHHEEERTHMRMSALSQGAQL